MMSRLSATWVFLWAVLACIGLLIWQAVRDKDKNDPNPSAVEAGGDGSSAKLASGKGTLGEQGRPRQSKGNLMAKLKDPENPPEGLEDEAQRKWLDDYIAKIDDASYLDDEESLLLLIVEYGNPNLEISEAAYSSLMARHDKAAIPYLKEIRAFSDSAKEQVKIDELIEFLNTKSIFEHLKSKER